MLIFLNANYPSDTCLTDLWFRSLAHTSVSLTTFTFFFLITYWWWWWWWCVCWYLPLKWTKYARRWSNSQLWIASLCWSTSHFQCIITQTVTLQCRWARPDDQNRLIDCREIHSRSRVSKNRWVFYPSSSSCISICLSIKFSPTITADGAPSLMDHTNGLVTVCRLCNFPPNADRTTKEQQICQAAWQCTVWPASSWGFFCKIPYCSFFNMTPAMWVTTLVEVLKRLRLLLL